MSSFDKMLKHTQKPAEKLNEGYDADDAAADGLANLIDQLKKNYKMSEKEAETALRAALGIQREPAKESKVNEADETSYRLYHR